MAAARKPKRWPKGTHVGADGRGGGRFAPKHAYTVASPAKSRQPARRAKARMDALDTAIDSGPGVAQPPIEGNSRIREIAFPNGTVAMLKQLLPVRGMLAFDDHVDPEQQADAEELSGLLGTSIGAPIVAVVRTDDHEVLMEKAAGRSWEVEALPLNPDAERRRLAELAGGDAGLRLGVLDLLIDNWDRANPTNWHVTPDGPAGFDHAFAWSDPTADPSRPPPRRMLGPFAANYVRRGRWRATNPLHPADVVWLHAVLDDLRPQFARSGRLAWWQFAQARLATLATHATGTRRIFGA